MDVYNQIPSTYIFLELDTMYATSDVYEINLAHEYESSRLLRVIIKLQQVVSNNDPRIMSLDGDRYMLRLFHTHVFGQLDDEGNPVLDFGHIFNVINKLDHGSNEQFLLMSEDGENVLLLTYREVKLSLENAYSELCEAANIPISMYPNIILPNQMVMNMGMQGLQVATSTSYRPHHHGHQNHQYNNNTSGGNGNGHHRNSSTGSNNSGMGSSNIYDRMNNLNIHDHNGRNTIGNISNSDTLLGMGLIDGGGNVHPSFNSNPKQNRYSGNRNFNHNQGGNSTKLSYNTAHHLTSTTTNPGGGLTSTAGNYGPQRSGGVMNPTLINAQLQQEQQLQLLLQQQGGNMTNEAVLLLQRQQELQQANLDAQLNLNSLGSG